MIKITSFLLWAAQVGSGTTNHRDGSYRGFVFFDQDCEEGAIVSEKVTYADTKSPQIEVLHCLHGKLVYMKNWPAVPTERWRGRVGNFEFNEALNE